MDIISKKTNAKMFPKCNFHVLSEPQSQKPHAEQIKKNTISTGVDATNVITKRQHLVIWINRTFKNPPQAE